MKPTHVFRFTAAMALLAAPVVHAHIVPPEKFHPTVESYRRAIFLLNLNPVRWDKVKLDTDQIASGLETILPERAKRYREEVAAALARPTALVKEGEDPPGPDVRVEASRAISELSTRAVADLLTAELKELQASTDDRKKAAESLDLSRKYWAAFEYEVKATDQPKFRDIGLSWLQMANALGNAPLLGQGEIPVDKATIFRESGSRLRAAKLFGFPRCAKGAPGSRSLQEQNLRRGRANPAAASAGQQHQ